MQNSFLDSLIHAHFNQQNFCVQHYFNENYFVKYVKEVKTLKKRTIINA